jgi:predicted AlkP superfamily phosphohydrolase/phosphomutase
MSSKGKRRVCVIGLDGVPCDLLRDLAAQGLMPTMQKLVECGNLRKMKASLPEISAVSWTNFMTGSNPGNHGIFGFTDLHDHSYHTRFPNFLDVKSPTIWDLLGERRLKSIVINQPSTYPAKKIEGSLVSGFVAIELARAVYPLSHLAALEKMNYETDIDTVKARDDHEYLWNALDATIEQGQKAFDYFWSQDWNYFEFVVTGTDRLHHYVWNAYLDPQHPDHLRFLEYYSKVDRLIHRIVTEYEKLTDGIEGLYLLSDHGFTGIEREVYLNAYLQNTGYLKFDSAQPEHLTDLAPGTRAFAMDPSRIYLNLKGRFPRGVVEKNDRASLKREIAAALKELVYQGRRIVRDVFDSEEIYSGPQTPKGPDLIVLAESGFDMKGSLAKKDVFGLSDFTGMHTWDDAFFWSSKEHSGELTISDVAGLIMEHFE